MNNEHSHRKDKLFRAFENFHLFKGLPDDVLTVFYVAAREEIRRKGEIIVSEGDTGQDLYIIGAGTVDVYVNHGNRRETKIATLHKNEIFGEMCVIEPIERSATVVASETTLLYSLRSSCLNKVYQIWPEEQTRIMGNLTQTLTERIIALDPEYANRAT